MVAQQVAGAREMFLWLGSFYALAGTGMIMGFARCYLDHEALRLFYFNPLEQRNLQR